MKPCGYCGRENDDTTMYCMECGTPFTTEVPGKFADLWHWTPQSPLGLAFTSGLAALLISTGVFYGGSKVMGDWRMHHAGDTVTPVMYDLTASSPTGIPLHFITWYSYVSLISLGALIFTFFVCYNRCQKKSHGIITAILAFGIIGLLTFMPMFVPRLISFFWLVPVLNVVVLLGSVGFYIGAALQIFAGAWLLGWFRRQKPANSAL
jgi:hypothetical protein